MVVLGDAKEHKKKISASLKVSNMEITFKANSIVHCSIGIRKTGSISLMV